MAPRSQEEPDTRLLLHSQHAAARGCAKIIISSTDTDVIVITVSCYRHIKVDQLWIAFGKGKEFRWAPVHEIACALLFCHAYTGCDTVSTFHTKGKKSQGKLGMSSIKHQKRLLNLVVCLNQSTIQICLSLQNYQ